MDMLLSDFPLISAGFHLVQADKGRHPGSKTWYINRWAEIPREWFEEFQRVERALGKVTGLQVKDLFAKDEVNWWEDAQEGECMALQFVYGGVNDSCEEVLAAAGVNSKEIKVVEDLFNDFFDGEEGSRHDRLQELFITTNYQY